MAGHEPSYKMLESQVRHISDLEIEIEADERRFCTRHESRRACVTAGCARLHVDTIRNIAEFLSKCVGLTCLRIKVISNEYMKATSRRPAAGKELRRIENKILSFVTPFNMIRNIAWAKIMIMDKCKS